MTTTVIQFPSRMAAQRPGFTVPEFAKTDADPVCKAITKHYAAYAAWLMTSNDHEQSAKGDREIAALTALMETRPTTVAGCVAMLRYFGDYTREIESPMLADFTGPVRSLGENFLAMIADVLEGL